MFEVDFDSQEDMDGDIQLSLSFYNSSNVRLATLSTRNLSMMTRIRKGSNQIRFIVPRMPLYPDLFSVCLYAEKDNSGMAHITDAATFQTTAGSF